MSQGLPYWKLGETGNEIHKNFRETWRVMEGPGYNPGEPSHQQCQKCRSSTRSVASLRAERWMLTGAKAGEWVKGAGGECSGEEPRACPREAAMASHLQGASHVVPHLPVQKEWQPGYLCTLECWPQNQNWKQNRNQNAARATQTHVRAGLGLLAVGLHSLLYLTRSAS